MTTEFYMLDQETRTKFEAHVQQHEQLWDETLAKEAQRAQLKMVANGGQPPPPQENAQPPQ
jgi:hypothetical protein